MISYKKYLNKNILGVIYLTKANEIIEANVLNFESKNNICKIEDILVNNEVTKIIGLLCGNKGIKKRKYILYLKDIISKSYDGIFVKNSNSIIDIAKLKTINAGLSYRDNILNKIVLNSKGELIGILRDMIFGFTAGELLGFELSEGYFDDIFTGRKLIKAGSGYYFLENNIIVPYEDVVQEQGRGLINLNKLYE